MPQVFGDLIRAWRIIGIISVACLPAFGCLQVAHIESYANGKPKRVGKLQNGEQEGEWNYYYENGARQGCGNYVHDIQEGFWTYWYPNGEKEMEGTFAAEKREGLWRYYHRTGGFPRAHGRFQDGWEAGPWMFWNAQGEREKGGEFHRGRPALQWTYWHPGGARKAEGYYLNGARVGPWRYWDETGGASSKSYAFPSGYELLVETWESGKVRREGFTLAGMPVGRWVVRHRNGSPRIAGGFAEGVPDGPWMAWDEKGELLAAGTIEKGTQAGDWCTWSGGVAQPLKSGVRRPPALTSVDWSPDNLASEQSAEAVVEVWLAEAASPLEADRSSAIGMAAVVAPTPAPPAPLELEAAKEIIVPIIAQPWTVREEQNFERYVADYGATPQPAARSGASRYRGRGAAGAREQAGGDQARAAALTGKPLPVTEFQTADGGTIDVATFRGKKNVLLVVLRGFSGQVCVYCTAQTTALADSFAEFAALNTEVLVVFPGQKGGMDAFKQAFARTPAKEKLSSSQLLYDPDLDLVGRLDLKYKLARPTTLILDSEGIVRFAYVGLDISDRPPVKRLVEEIKAIGAK